LAWRLSITMEAAFCVETLEDALARYGKPDVNTDQGSQFTGAVFTRRARQQRHYNAWTAKAFGEITSALSGVVMRSICCYQR
jgi:hypothetical protein